jgi:streptomycin 6-kinase
VAPGSSGRPQADCYGQGSRGFPPCRVGMTREAIAAQLNISARSVYRATRELDLHLLAAGGISAAVWWSAHRRDPAVAALLPPR